MREVTRNTRDERIVTTFGSYGRAIREVVYDHDGRMKRGKILGYGNYEGTLPVYVRHFGSDGVYTSGSRFSRDGYGRPVKEEKFRYDPHQEEGRWIKTQELRNKFHGLYLTECETREFPSQTKHVDHFTTREERCSVEPGFTEQEIEIFDEKQRVAEGNELTRKLGGIVARGTNRAASRERRAAERKNNRPLDGIVGTDGTLSVMEGGGPRVA